MITIICEGRGRKYTDPTMNTVRRYGFTLIELLVVVAIIAILAAILFPVFARARLSARATANTSNLRQISIGIAMYHADAAGYPMHSSPATAQPRTRWPDYIQPYCRDTNIFNGPLAPREMFRNRWAHRQDLLYGGYGYNYQYLGNSRSGPEGSGLPFTAKSSTIPNMAQTLAVADTMGVRDDTGAVTAGVYVVDPPLPSARGSGRVTGYYAEPAQCGSGTPGTPGKWGCRAVPAEWSIGRVTIAWCDGHASSIQLIRLDDMDGDGTLDNGFFNGWGDPGRR